MSRRLNETESSWKPIEVSADSSSALQTWMIAQAHTYRLRYLLGYADDGVIWGKFENSELTLAGNIFPDDVGVALLPQTLQQARLFGASAEVMLWRADGTFNARVISDGVGKHVEYFDEENWLWGTRGNLGKEKSGFTLLFEGRQDLRHAPPIANLKQTDRVALVARNYLDAQDGQTFIARTRLVDLKIVGGQHGA